MFFRNECTTFLNTRDEEMVKFATIVAYTVVVNFRKYLKITSHRVLGNSEGDVDARTIFTSKSFFPYTLTLSSVFCLD